MYAGIMHKRNSKKDDSKIFRFQSLNFQLTNFQKFKFNRGMGIISIQKNLKQRGMFKICGSGK